MLCIHIWHTILWGIMIFFLFLFSCFLYWTIEELIQDFQAYRINNRKHKNGVK